MRITSTIGPRTLIYTHLTPKKPEQLKTCLDFWVRPGGLFDKKLSIYNAEGKFPAEMYDWRGVENRLFSYSGALDDPTCAALSEGFAGPGDRLVALGGGMLNNCLFETFASLVRIKSALREDLQVIIPFPLIYTFWQMDLLAFVSSENKYVGYLKEKMSEGLIGGYRVTHDQKPLPGQVKRLVDLKGQPQVEVHWFTALTGMLSSRFFLP